MHKCRNFEFYNYLGKLQKFSQRWHISENLDNLTRKRRRSKQFQSSIGGQVKNLPFFILNQRSSL